MRWAGLCGEFASDDVTSDIEMYVTTWGTKLRIYMQNPPRVGGDWDHHFNRFVPFSYAIRHRQKIQWKSATTD